MTETVKRIVDLIEQCGKSVYMVEKKAELSLSSIISWKSDNFQPSVDSIKKLAKYFNVSADYLLCLTNAPMPLKNASVFEVNLATLARVSLNQQFIDIAKLYMAMTSENKYEIYTVAQEIAAEQGLDIKRVLGK